MTSIYFTITEILPNLKGLTFIIRFYDYYFSLDYRNITEFWIDARTFTAFIFESTTLYKRPSIYFFILFKFYLDGKTLLGSHWAFLDYLSLKFLEF